MNSKNDQLIMYGRFAAMMVLSYLLMFAFMYAMVDRLANVYPNINQAYMAGLMVAPMAVLELMLMSAMYANKCLNMLIIAVSFLLLLLCWFGIRQQFAVDDRSFLRAMIPHHAGAILMCNQASLSDGEIRKLCGEIVKSQQQEIDQMRGILQRLP